MEEKKIKFISLSKAAKEIGRTSEYLNFLVRQGKFKAEKLGRNWYTKKEWINDFLAVLNSPKDKPVKKKQPKEKDFSGSLKVVLITQPAASAEKKKFPLKLEEDLKTKQPAILPEKTFWPPLMMRLSFLLVFFLIIFFSLAFLSFFLRNQEFSEKLSLEVFEDSFLARDKKGTIISQSGKVKGEEAESAASAVANSENFRLKEISFGGIVLASTDGEKLPLEISDLKSKIFLSKDGKEAQALITWNTNKLAVSEISYEKIGALESKALQENLYGFSHQVVLTSLDLDTTYTFSIKASDRWNNETLSDKFAFFSGSKVVSVFDLIVKAAGDTFGWAMKK